MYSYSMKKQWNKTRKETGYRSKFEDDLAQSFDSDGREYAYESMRIPYQIVEVHTYKPDFVFPRECFLLEAKGYFTSEDRTKMLLVKEQYPDLDIRMCFYAEVKVTKGAKMTNVEWCKKHGIPCCVGTVPPSWFKEERTQAQKDAFYEFFRTGVVPRQA